MAFPFLTFVFIEVICGAFSTNDKKLYIQTVPATVSI
jgi:uncharacterized membrane protein